jgi:hypothetical protein
MSKLILVGLLPYRNMSNTKRPNSKENLSIQKEEFFYKKPSAIILINHYSFYVVIYQKIEECAIK